MDRQNNFNLLRMFAALLVLFTHSFALSFGSSEAEPLRGRLGMTLGDIAVDLFFVTSGFLVTGSLTQRKTALHFVRARALRIFPGLIVMLFITTYFVGPLVTSIPVIGYIKSISTHRYFFQNSLLLSGIDYILPGVFTQNPFAQIVNGSLWTLPYEIAMYGLILVGWIVALFFFSSPMHGFRLFVIVGLLASFFGLITAKFFGGSHLAMYRLAFMFLTGALYYIFRDGVVLKTWPVAIFILAAFILTLFRKTELLFCLYCLAIGYSVLWFAYVPKGDLLAYNKLGDYSYGVYIYSFPVQQLLINQFSLASPLMVAFISLLVTIPLSILSWNVVEKPALKLKYARI